MARPFTVIDCPQHLEDGITANPDWLAARLGRVTGTGANDMLAQERVAGKGGRTKLKRRLAMERLTGQPFGKTFANDSMVQGLQREPEARIAYERAKNVIVMTCGFVAHNTWLAGCSPDGYIGDFEGGISIKCPEQFQHLDWLRGGDVDLDYRRQMTHEMLICGFQWIDFVSFNPDMPERMRLFVKRFERNDIELKKHQDALESFLQEVEAEYLSLKLYAEGMAS